MERGTAGLEMGIMLIAPAVVAATIGASLMRAGDAASRTARSSVLEAIQGAGAGIETDGLLLARTDGTRVTHLLVDVTATPGGAAGRLDSQSASERTIVAYIDSGTVERDVPYTIRWIRGNGDGRLDDGEVAEVDVDLSGIMVRDRFTIEIRPPRGAYVSLRVEIPGARPMPSVLQLY